MRCASCGAFFDPGDNYCRHCGEQLNHGGLSMVVSRSLLPVPWSMAKGPVLRGVAALIVGTAVELVRREVVKRTSQAIESKALATLLPESNTFRTVKRGKLPWSRKIKGECQITETVIQRQIWFRR